MSTSTSFEDRLNAWLEQELDSPAPAMLGNPHGLALASRWLAGADHLKGEAETAADRFIVFQLQALGRVMQSLAALESAAEDD